MSPLQILLILSLLHAGSTKRLPDWLVTSSIYKTTFSVTSQRNLLLTNGLISREFQRVPDLFTVDFYSHEKESSLLRAIKPEAVISLDGVVYNVGGIITTNQTAYLNRTELDLNLKLDPMAFNFLSYQISTPKAPFPYKPKRFAPENITWPPKGVHVDFVFAPPFSAPAKHQRARVVVHYEMYDGIPLVVKWVTISMATPVANLNSVYSISNKKESVDVINQSKRQPGQTTPLTINSVQAAILSVEYLAVNKPWANQGHGWLDISTDQPPHGIDINWSTDPSASKMPGSFQYNVNCSYSKYFTVQLPEQEQFESFRVHELVVPTSDPERLGLARRRLLRLLAPHTQENPIFFHMTNSTPAAMKSVIDQMADVGFEMLIYSFGSGFDIESDNQTYINQVRDIVSYAHSKGIEVGGYDLVSLTRNPGPNHSEFAAIDPHTLEPTGNACFASGWYDYLLEKFTSFMEATGISMVETDGPYGSFECASHNHSYHAGIDDNIYWNVYYQGLFFKKLRERQIYINQPDNYFFYGGSKTGMGYNEEQYSLPRWQDLSISRQGMYDDLYHYTPTIGWMFMPLVQYHGGGANATFEPLSKNRQAYEWALAQYFGSGVAACYRGYRLYDNYDTKNLVTDWVAFYKLYRDILISDVIHVKRADMQGIDCLMHINPYLRDYKALAMVFNPTDKAINTNLTLPLYYTGLTDFANIGERAANYRMYTLDRFFEVDVLVKLSATDVTWFLIK